MSNDALTTPRLAYLSEIDLALEGERRASGRHAEPLDLPERVDDVLGDPVAEELVLRVGAHVRERQDGDGWQVRLACGLVRWGCRVPQCVEQVSDGLIPA